MEFKDVLRTRRMVRNYADLPLDNESLDRILDAGIRAPSAGFSQGQRFVVVTDEALRSRIALAASEDEYVEKGFDPWISKAPAHIVICADRGAYETRYSEADKNGIEEWTVPYWWVDAGASMMAMLYAAVDEGLAAGFLGAHALENLRSVLGIPEEILIVGVMTVGHPAPDRTSSSLQRGRLKRGNQIRRNHW